MSDISDHYKNRDPSQRVCARALCIHDGRLLVIERHKYGKDYIVLPGGGIDEGESDFAAAYRELFEETSIVAKPLKLLLTIPGTQDHSEQRIVLCEYVSGEPYLDQNSEEAQRTDEGRNTYTPKWVDLAYAAENLLPVELRRLIG